MPHKQCICQICNCGRHRCPHRSGRTSIEVDDNVHCFITEYGSRYAGDLADRTESFQPKNRPFRVPETQMQRQSTTAQDFPSHPVQKTDDFRPQREYAEPQEAMDLNTTYNAVYVGQQGEKEKSYRPANRVIGGGQFRAEPTSQDYKEWPINKRQLILPHSEMEHPTTKFDNKSETQTHFVKLDGKTADSAKPPQTANLSTDPFDSKTSHQIEYTPKELPEKYHRDKMVFQPPTVPQNMSSTYYDNYKGNPTPKAESFKPKNAQYRYGDDTMGISTHKTDFIPLPLPDTTRHQPEVHEADPTAMDLNTTHNIAYSGTYGPRAVPIRPKEKRQGDALFRSSTTHGTDYQPWEDARRKPIILEKPYAPPEHKFEAKSEAQSQFQGDQAPAAVSMKPAAKPVPTGEFHGRTSHVSDYPIKDIDCPVKTLHEDFHHTHKHEGHHYFKRK